MKTLFNRIRACATQAAGQNTMSNTNTPRSAREMQSNNGWQVDDRVMSSESPTNHLLITYYSPTIVSMQSAAIKAVKRAYISAWRYAAVLVITILGAWNINAWGAKPVNDPATKSYGGLTFLDVANTKANCKITASGAVHEGDSTLTYGAYYVAKTLKITTWYNSSDGSPASNLETTGYSIDNAAQFGFFAVSSTSSDINYGGTKCHSTRVRYFYVTGATHVAAILRDNNTSGNKYARIVIQTVASDGTLGAATNVGTYGSKDNGYLRIGGDLDASKYYKISFDSPAGSNCYMYQMRLGKATASCTNPTASWSTAPADGVVGGSMTASVTTNYSTGLRFSSSDATVASVNATTGAISYLKAGTTTITATVTGDGSTYCAGPATVSKAITVTAPPSSTYYYRGGDNGWGATAMTVSAGGLYEYYQSSNSSNQFKIALSADGWEYNYSYVNSGYCSTNVTEIGDYKENGIPNNCYCWKSGTYYIIVFKPNTAMNATSKPIICASTTLPVESVTVSKTLTNVSVTGTAIPTTSNQCGSFSTTISASTGYNLPSTITVTGASHTWNSSTGALTINSITGNVAITIVGVAKTTTITLNANTANHGSGTNKSVTATYNAALPSFTACTPASGYSLTGYFTAATGGTKIINADGTLVASTTYTNASAKWTGTAATLTLYAQYEVQAATIRIGVTNSSSYAASFTSSSTDAHITANATSFTMGSSTNSGSSTYSSATAPYSIKFKPSSNINTSSYSDNYSISASFSVASGYTFTPTSITAKIVTEAANYYYKATISDATTTYTSSEVTSSGNGVFTFSFSSFDTPLSGTVTFKIWYRSTANNTKFFVVNQLPILINGIVAELPTCTAPTGLAVDGITATGATFTVTDAANTNKYEFYYSTSSTAPTSSTAATATATAKTKAVTGLTAATTYYAWVRSDCGGGIKSSWVALTGSTFTTGCVAPTSVSISGRGQVYTSGTASDNNVRAITLTAEVTGGAGVTTTYQWQHYNSSTSAWDNVGTNSATFTKTAVLADAGRYRCVVSKDDCPTTSNEVLVRIYQLELKNTSDVVNTYLMTSYGEDTATCNPTISGQETWHFRIIDNCGNIYSNSGTMTSSNCTAWNMAQTGDKWCGIEANTKTTGYRFILDFRGGYTGSDFTVSVEYPGSNQAAGYVVFLDNNVLNWTGTLYYRIGRGDHTTAIPLTKVKGTDNLYKFITPDYTNFEYWHICNNAGWTNYNPIDKTKTGDGYAITESSSFQGSPITGSPGAEYTFTPVEEGHIGERDQNNNCYFYDINRTSGMKKWNLTANTATNGVITITYKDTADVSQTILSTDDTRTHAVAHTCIATVSATPNTGYQLATLTVNNVDHTSGNTHIVVAATTARATFTACSYTVTLNNQSATTAGTASVATTFNATTNLTTKITVPTKTDYEFGGYYTGTGGSGVKLIDETGAWIASVDGYTSATKQWLNPGNVTLYAYWIANEYCYTFTPLTSGSAPSTGDVISGTGSGGTMTMLGGQFGYTANGLEFQSSGSSKVSVSLDNNMAVGTVITATIYIGDASARGLYLYNSSGTKKATFSQSAVGTYTFTYTVVAGDGLEGNNTFQLWRYNNATLKSLKIHHCGVAKIDPTVYTFSNGTFASWATCTAAATKKLTLSGSQSGVSYQLYKGGVAEGDPKAGTGSALEWLITASGVYTCKSVENSTYKEGTMTGTATVTIQDPTIVGETSVDVEGNITLTHPGDAASGSWATSDASKATVSSAGVVTGVAEGSATITFTGTGGCTDTHVVSVVLPSSESCITITNFETSNHGKVDNKPDSQSKYIYGYKGSMTTANAVTITTDNTNNKGQNSGVEMRADNSSTTRIYADNATSTTPASFEDVVSVSFDAKLYNSGSTTRSQPYTIKVGSTTVGSGTITGLASDGYKHITTGSFEAKDGYIDIILANTGSSNTNLYIDNIEICTGSSGFVLNYNANGGTGTTASQAGTSLTVKTCGFTRSGYAFDHWNTSADDSGDDYAPGDPITLTGTTTLYAQWVEEMESECSWAYWFTYAADATSNGKTNNSTVFSGCITDGSSGTGSATVEGTKFDFTRHSGSKSGNVGRLIVPAGHKATFYAVVNPGGSSKSMKLVPSVGEEILISPLTNSDGAVIVFENLPAGTYTINYPVSLSRTYMYAAYICADCADKRPEITGSLTGCPTVTLTATNYTDGALLQWYKKVGSDFVALDGETDVTYTATETGLYKLAAQKTCRLETEPVSVTISLAVNSTAIPTATKTYEQGAAATPLTASVLAEGDAATTASEYLWQYQEWDGSAWGALTTIDDATTSSYTPSTATVCRKRYRVGARNNCNEGVWKYSGYVTIDVIASSTVTGSWKVDGANVTSSAKGYVQAVNAGGWYDVKATFTTTTATPTITMMTDGVKMDNRVVDGTTITARVYVPASAADTVRVKAAVEAVTTGTAYSSCEIILKLAVTQCASNTKLPVKSSYTDAGSGYTGWRYYWETAGVGKITAKSGVSTISQESASYEGFSYRNGSNGSEYRFQTYIGGVSKVRVYVYNDASSVRTVSNVYYHTAMFTDKPSGYEISPTIIYQYPDEGGIKGKSNSYFDIVLSTPMIPNSCMAIILNNNVKIYGVELTGSTGGGTVPTLQWNQSSSATLDDIHTSPGSSLMQKASIKTPDKFKSIATIQYRSTNRDVATVDNATGEVTIVSPSTILVAETCSIAAKLPVSGCYAGSAEIYYRVIVDPCPDKAPVIATDRNDYCVGHEPVISITSYDGEITGWFKDGVKIPDTEGLTSITASGIGNYYVTTHKTCDVDVRSNSIVIVAAAAPSVTVLHSGWHIRRGREIGVPLQLFKVEGTNLTTTIDWTLNGASHTLNGVTCSLVDGIYQMTGTPSGSGAATLTGTITVTNECGQSTTKSTTIIVDPAAANIQVAYVVKGTKGGGWTATQADNLTGLYTYLSSVPTFDVTACNGYNTTVLEDLLTYYSQYDVVVLTDYLNSGEKPASGNPGYNKANNISYSDAFGCLVDVKPMLTTEAYVSGKSQWTKVGLTSNPSDGTNTDNQSLKMRLLCPSAAIFTSIDPSTIDGEKYIQVADALPGGSENKMLQGFAPTAARDFVFMATVMGGDGKELITLCERQTQIRARLMVFGLNWHGSEKLNADGNLAVKQIIEYLLNWDPAQVIDCAIYFNNRTNDGNWGTPGNWGPAYNHVPKYYENVRIEQPVTVNVDNAVAANVKIAITSEGNVKGASDATVSSPRVLNGKMEIAPTGALTVNGGIYMVDSKGSRDFTTKQQVPANLLSIGSSTAGQGALAFGEINNNMLPRARVGLYSPVNFTLPTTLAEYESFIMPWQYIGTPYSDGVAQYQYYNAWMCRWDESAASDDKAWIYIDDYDKLVPFQGYALSQQSATYYCQPGLLNKPENKNFTLRKSSSVAEVGGYNFLANSFTAPIELAKLESTDFENAEATIYMFNSGDYNQWTANKTTPVSSTTAGQYIALPVNAASYTGTLSAIPPMQGFFVKATSDGGSFAIDYEKAVLDINATMAGDSKSTSPLRAPRRTRTIDDDDPIRVTTILLQGESAGDMVSILTGSEEFTDGFDNGWDGTKMLSDDRLPILSVMGKDEDYSVSSQPQLEGTVLNFRAGNDEEYVLTIATPISGLVLKDLVSNAEIPLIDTTEYVFNSANRTIHPRFVISRKHNVVTDTEQNLSGSFNAYVQDGKIVIDNKSGYAATAFVYDTTGKLIQSSRINVNSNVQVEPVAAQGVYMVRIITTEATNTIKVTF